MEEDEEEEGKGDAPYALEVEDGVVLGPAVGIEGGEGKMSIRIRERCCVDECGKWSVTDGRWMVVLDK